MKILIVSNNGWDKKVWNKMTAGIKEFYEPVYDLEFEIVNTKLDPVYTEGMAMDGIENKKSTYKFIDWIWLRAVFAPYKADIYLFADKSKDTSGFPTGIASGKHIQMFVDDSTSQIYQNGKAVGNAFVIYACHEIAHSIYAKLGVTDRTHEYFYGGTPEKVLTDFQLIPLYQKAINLAKQVIAELQRKLSTVSTKQK